MGVQNFNIQSLSAITGTVRKPAIQQGFSKLCECVRKLLAMVRRKQFVPANAVPYETAARQFLNNMQGSAARTFPQWQRTIEDGMAEHGLALPDGGLIAKVPLDDFYFVGFAALEASKLPELYTPAEAATLFSEIGEQIDSASGRYDRVMSDLFFQILGRLNMLRLSSAQTERRPYDTIVKTLLKALPFGKSDTAQALMADKGLRHRLAEPFALHLQSWWAPFKQQFELHQPEQPDEAGAEEQIKKAIAATAAAQRPKPKRWHAPASSMFQKA
jgi:hypothetical protein